MRAPNDNATQILTRLSGGDRAAAASLMPLVYDELRRVAGAMLRSERSGHTLQPTALVHEVYLKLVDQTEARWNDRAHFCAVAAQAMRRVLIDHARTRKAAKRSGGERITLDGLPEADPAVTVDLVDLDAALESLAALSPRQAEVVTLRYFGGLTVEEAAHVLDVSPRTVKGDWRVARAWLQARIAESGDA